MRTLIARSCFLLVIVVCAVVSAAAQHEGALVEGPPLTLTAAIDEALAKNPELIALRAQSGASKLKPAEERFLNPPMIETQVWQWPINSVNPSNVSMFMVMATQDLPGRGKRQLRAAIGEKDAELADNDVAVQAVRIVNQVKQSYAALFIARKAIDVHLSSLELVRQIADAAQVKYVAGRVGQGDVVKSVVELTTLRSDLVMFEAQADVAAARLNVLLDRAPEARVGALAAPRGEMALPETAELQRLALKKQPELRRARLEIERAEAELASTRQETKPDFSIQGGYGIVPNGTDALMAKFGVSWPNAPWSRGKIDARVAAQTAGIQASKARARAMENGVRLAVQEAYVRAASAQERASLLRTTVLPEVRHALDVSRVAYQSDRVDASSLIESQRTELGSELDYFRALSEFDQAMADLENAVGSGIAEVK